MTLFWCQTGPKVSWHNGMFVVEDLNPEAKISWRMGRREMIRLGWHCIVAALGLKP